MGRSTSWCGISIPPSFSVVLCTFLMACSQVGTIKSIGIYLEDISRSLGTTSTDIGVALGLFTAFTYFPAPIIAALYRLKWMHRLLRIAGSIMVPLGVIMTSLATNNILIDVYLAIAGLGHCMLITTSTLALHQISDGRRFNLLYGIGMSGFGLGMILLPYAADILGRAYGWRGGLLILGGLMMNLVPSAMAIKTEEESSGRDDTMDGPLEECPSGDAECSGISEEDNDCVIPLLDKSSHCGLIRQYQSNPNEQPLEQVRQTLYNHQELGSSSTFDRLLAQFRSSDFYTDPVFNFLFASNVCLGVLYCGWHGFLVPHALQRGYSVQKTLVMTLFASIGNFLGRLLAGALSDRLTEPIMILMSAIVLTGTAILCDVFIQHYYVMAVSAFLTAIGIAGMAILFPLSVRKRCSPETFGVAYAVSLCSFGLGSFLGGYLSGLVGGIYSSYNATFKLLVGADVLAFLFMLPPFILKKP